MTSLVVLLVDDDEMVRDIHDGLLREYGFDVVPASSAEEAVAIMESRQVDVMLADIKMPNGSGYWLAGVVETRFPNTKILLITGYVESIPSAAAHWPVIQKPCSGVKLARAISALLRNRRL